MRGKVYCQPPAGKISRSEVKCELPEAKRRAEFRVHAERNDAEILIVVTLTDQRDLQHVFDCLKYAGLVCLL
jgi:hypothetical protein